MATISSLPSESDADHRLDDASAHTAAECAHHREQVVAREAAERLGFFAHEVRNHLFTAQMAFAIVQSESSGGAGGRACTILGRSLMRLAHLVERSFAEVRIESGIRRRQRISIAEFMKEIGATATMEAEVRGLQLTITEVAAGVEMEVDEQILAEAVVNLLHNAFKFTRPNGQVRLSTVVTTDRVFIEVEDECGGLSGVDHDHLFRPFEQQRGDRRGLGLGLAICRKGVEANGGRLSVRNRPGVSCMFVVDMPRYSPPVVA